VEQIKPDITGHLCTSKVEQSAFQLKKSFTKAAGKKPNNAHNQEAGKHQQQHKYHPPRFRLSGSISLPSVDTANRE
jgi:hypothetical protein